MFEMVPVPGDPVLMVPSGAIVILAPARTPPRLEPCGGSRVRVPVVVIVPPVVEPFVDNPGPAVTPVKVPPRAEAATITPEGVTDKPDPRIRLPEGVETLYV
jgi:hypothetical protein